MTESLRMTPDQLQRWYEAASRRRSRRTYTGVEASVEQVAAIHRVCAALETHDARVVFSDTPGVNVFRGVIGSYGKVTGAPHLMLMIANETSKTSHQHAGFLGEAAVLEATALGLDTCWIGGFFSVEKVAGLVKLGRGERVVAVSPVGSASNRRSLTERTFTTMAASHNRKPLEEIAPGSTVWPSWASDAAACVRIAPSAMNRQPWRLRFEQGTLIVAKDSIAETPKVTKALDCGIAMLHAQLGAAAGGATGTWSATAHELDVAVFTPDTSGVSA